MHASLRSFWVFGALFVVVVVVMFCHFGSLLDRIMYVFCD